MQGTTKDKLKNLSPEQIRKLLSMRKNSDSLSKNDSFDKMERNPEQKYKLSKAQERIWFLTRLTENSSLYNIPVAVKLTQEITLNKLQDSLKWIVAENEILRTTFHEEDGTLYQKIHSNYIPSVEYQDISNIGNYKDKLELIESIAIENSAKEFDLTILPLFTISLIKLEEKEFVLLLNLQHIITDGWTNMLLSIDLNLGTNDIEASQHKKYSYIDFVKWEQDWLQSELYNKHLNFWKEKLISLPNITRFPNDFPEINESNEGSILIHNFDFVTKSKIDSFCKSNNYTPFQFYFLCFSLLVSIYTQENDLIIGVPVANRNSNYFQNTYGLFFNSLPLRIEIDKKQSFNQFMKNSIELLNQYMNHQEVPFSEIIKAINPNRNLEGNALFNIHFAYQHFPKKNKEEEYAIMPIDYKTSKFDVNLWVEVAGDDCKLSLTYKSKRIERAKIERFIEHYNRLIEIAINNSPTKISDFNLFYENQLSISKGKSKKINEISFIDLFYSIVEKFPNKIAVIDSSDKISYSELNHRANILANIYLEKSVSFQDVVILETGRTLNFIIGILACFKIGCSYLPIEENIPSEKLNFIIKDSNASILFSENKIDHIATITPEDIYQYSNDIEEIKRIVSLEETAYIIYTSGTTGKPKGVAVSHKSLVNYIQSINEILKDNTIQTYAHVSALNADLGNTTIFTSLGYGGTLLIPSKEQILDSKLLSKFFRENPVDFLKIVPSHLDAYLSTLDDILPSKVLMLGGEVISKSLISKITKIKTKSLRLINHYGPTESTIGVMTYEYDFDCTISRIPIGKPINNTQIFIMDKELNTVPLGVIGEICISGKCLAKGYVNDEHLTKQKFVVKEDKLLYRTGDKGLINERGDIIFLGRDDSQIKYNGFRIELGEIESILRNYNDIVNAYVYLIDEENSHKSLNSAIQVNNNFQMKGLKEYLKKQLPQLLIPQIIVIDNIPYTSNGKVDYKVFKEISKQNKSDNSIRLPVDLVELNILEIFKELFPNISISIDDSFFDIGGHSLLAIKLVSKINNKLKSKITISNLFTHSSVKDLSKLIRNEINISDESENLVSLVNRQHNLKSFWIHPAGGNIMCYYPIATALSGKYDTLAFDYTSYSNSNTLSINNLASEYYETLKQNNFVNNIFIGGWSMGALIAHQIGVIYKNENSIILPIILLDQPAINISNKQNISYEERLYDYIQKVYLFTDKRLDKTLFERKTINYQLLLDEFIRVQLTPDETTLESFKNFVDTLVEHNNIVSQFEPEMYDGPVLLLKAEEDLMESEIELQPDLGWSKYCSNLTIMKVPGNHITMINSNNSKQIATVIENWLGAIN